MKIFNFKTIHLVTTTAIIAPLSIFASPSYGQTAAADTSGQIEEIVVTAQKRSENLQDVPIAITAVTAAAAKAAGIGSTTDIGAVTPGLTITQTSNAPLFFLRGVGTALSVVGDEGSVNVVVDGVPYTSLAGSIFTLNNVERIEVLRGPQGTLFGRNADGGVISVITRDPKSDPSADISVGYGNYNTLTGSAYVTTGLAKGIAIDAAIQYDHQKDGYGHNLFNGADVNRARDFSARSKLKIDATDTTTIRLSGDYFKSTSDLGIPRRIVEGAVSTVLHSTALPDFYDVNENIQPAAHSKSYGGNLRVEQILPWAQITSITAYRRSTTGYDFDQDAEPIALVNAFFHDREHQFSQEVQLGSLPESRIKWIVGGFYLKSRAAGDPITLGGISFAPLGGFQDRFGTLSTRSLAGFGQVTVPLGNTTNVTGGLRYTSDRRGFDYHQSSPVVPSSVPVDITKTYNKLTWRLSIDQKITDDILAYASYSRGFKSGLFNVINPANPPIRPETLDAYEAGVKSELFDRHLRLNLSGFYYNYKDIQVSQIVAGQAFFLNAAKARIYGLDVDFQATPVQHFTLSGGLELLHARYRSFPGAPATFPNPIVDADPVTPGIQCGANPQLAPGPRTGGNTSCVIDASGKQMVRAPDMQFSLTGRYVIPSSVGEFGISATLAHSSSFPWEPDNRLRQTTTNIVNGQLSWDAPGNGYGVRVWAKNLTKVKYYLQQSSSIGDSGEAAPPRTYGVTLEAHF